MKFLTFKIIVLALSLTATGAQASTLALLSDTNPLSYAEQYQFSSTGSNSFTGSIFTGRTFSDIINLTIAPNRDFVASLSGTSNELINFTTFDLYSGFSDGVNTLVQAGQVFSPSRKLSIGSLTSSALAGNYFISIKGNQSGFSSYNGNISLTSNDNISQPSNDKISLNTDALVPLSAVPLPAALPLMLSGVSMLGFARSRNKQVS